MKRTMRNEKWPSCAEPTKSLRIIKGTCLAYMKNRHQSNKCGIDERKMIFGKESRWFEFWFWPLQPAAVIKKTYPLISVVDYFQRKIYQGMKANSFSFTRVSVANVLITHSVNLQSKMSAQYSYAQVSQHSRDNCKYDIYTVDILLMWFYQMSWTLPQSWWRELMREHQQQQQEESSIWFQSGWSSPEVCLASWTVLKVTNTEVQCLTPSIPWGGRNFRFPAHVLDSKPIWGVEKASSLMVHCLFRCRVYKLNRRDL